MFVMELTGTLKISPKTPNAKITIAGSSRDREVPTDLTVLIDRPKENDGALVSFNFKSDKPAHDEAGRGESSRPDRPRKARGEVIIDSYSANAKATLRAGSVLGQRCFPDKLLIISLEDDPPVAID